MSERRLIVQRVPLLISREEALRLGELEDHAELEALASADPAALTGRLWDPASQLRKRSVTPRPDGAPNIGRDPVT